MNKNSIFVYMMLQRKEKRGMGIAIWKLTYSLTTYPPTQKDFFFFEGKEALNILGGFS